MPRIITPERIEDQGDSLGYDIISRSINIFVSAVLLPASLFSLENSIKNDIKASRIGVGHTDFCPSHDPSLGLLERMDALNLASLLKSQWLEVSRYQHVAGRYVFDFIGLVYIWFTWLHNSWSASSICASSGLLFFAIQEIRLREYSFAPKLPRDNGFRERFGDTINRNRSVFGVDWFFEWPQGRRPLNSTWPWAGVKPSLLVLWGVCWMFYMRVGYSQDHIPQGPRLYQRFDVQTSIQGCSFAVAQRPRHHKGHHVVDAGDLPIKQEPLEGPTMVYQQHDSETTLVRQAKQAVALGGRYQATAPQGIRNVGGITHPAVPGSQGIGVYNYYHDPSAYANAAGAFVVQPAQTTVPEAGVAEWRALGEQAAQTLRGPPYQVPPPHHHNQNSPQQYYGHAHLVPSHYPVSSTRFYPNPTADMSLSYESRTFMPDANYPDMQITHHPQDQEDFKHDQPRYPSPPPPLSENPYNPQAIGAPPDDRLEIPELPKDESEAASPGRSKPVPKPDREVTRYDNGRFYCNWPNCTEEVREFNRKCEWSKHMDKHDRPYKCPAEGCEKLPGFTYSGGLLRHEREVHNKHGGPRKQLNCPHPNCKRHTGKGFSRQENLNEHLRRVHTDTGLIPNGDDTEEDGSDGKTGQKRKRISGRSDSADLREEMKRLRQENEELRRQSEAQTAQTAEMMRQIQQLQASMHPRMQAPQAPMM